MAVWKQIVCLVASISAVQAFLPGQTRYASDLVRGTNDVGGGLLGVGVCVCVCLYKERDKKKRGMTGQGGCGMCLCWIDVRFARRRNPSLHAPPLHRPHHAEPYMPNTCLSIHNRLTCLSVAMCVVWRK
jgi:hypothetical protein